MNLRLPLVLALSLLATSLPSQAADAEASTAPDAASAACAAAAPPCGYIVPQMTLDFPGKPSCRAETLGGPIDLSKCIPLPAVGAEHVEEGIFRMSWDITQDGTYPADPTQPIVISFGGTSTNPDWMDLEVEPASVELDAVAIASPVNTKVDGQKVLFWYEIPIKATFTRTGDGDVPKSLDRIERGQGAVQMFLKAKSTASGQYFKEAFGVEEFRFSSCANDDALSAQVDQCGAATSGQESPGAGAALSAVALVALAAALRRRRA